MQLAENITSFYFSHFDMLDDEKKFHFSTRLSAWNNDQRAKRYLEQARPQFVPNPCNEAALKSELQEVITNPPKSPVNARELRKPYFAAFPLLRGIDLGLFRVRHLKEVYGVDARAALFDLYPKETLLEFEQSLLANDGAMLALSTYAINFIYLLERVMLERIDEEAINVSALYELGKTYDTNNPNYIQLLIYFYTHCIIGKSNFYVRQVAPAYLPIYQAMLHYLESVIEKRFVDISLDSKLELLVCCRLIGHNSRIEKRIYDECTSSLSDDGTFLVDRHNNQKDPFKTSLNKSEHRNVLFIMSQSPYILQSAQDKTTD